MNRSFVRVVALLSFLASAAYADTVHIYSGVVKYNQYLVDSLTTTSQGAYLIVDPTVSKFALISYDRKMKTAANTVVTATMNNTYPFSPISPKSHTFIMADVKDGTFPINFYRLRSPTAPVVTPVTSTLSESLPKTLTLIQESWAPAAYFIENTGTFTYQKLLSIQSNDAGNDLNTAVNLVFQHLRDLHYIN